MSVRIRVEPGTQVGSVSRWIWARQETALERGEQSQA